MVFVNFGYCGNFSTKKCITKLSIYSNHFKHVQNTDLTIKLHDDTQTLEINWKQGKALCPSDYSPAYLNMFLKFLTGITNEYIYIKKTTRQI